jgi:RNA recognition motif-containing protein
MDFVSIYHLSVLLIGIPMNIYVGNLPYTVREEELRQIFGSYGTVDSATVIIDKLSGRSRGFGFVEMNDDADAQSAIDAMNGSEVNGRALVVNQARAENGQRPSGGGRDREFRRY